jgi:hypothetical protein
LPDPGNEGHHCKEGPVTSERERQGLDVAAIADRTAKDAGTAPRAFLDGYIEMLATVSATGRRLARDELDTRRVLGATAAQQDIPLRALVDLYLSANWLTWRELPTITTADGKTVRAVAETILRAADDEAQRHQPAPR